MKTVTMPAIDVTEEAVSALNDPAQTEAELAEGFKKWLADLEGGAIQNIDILINRDVNTEREEMWLRLRDDYGQMLTRGT